MGTVAGVETHARDLFIYLAQELPVRPPDFPRFEQNEFKRGDGHGPVDEEFLRNVPDLRAFASADRALARDEVEQSAEEDRLASCIGPEHRQRLSFVDRERDVFQKRVPPSATEVSTERISV